MMLSMFLRSFFIQAGWNFERNQNVGFAFALLPALRRIYGATGRFQRALLRHLEVFNTQPHMAGFVLGNIAKMEERLADEGESPEAVKSMAGVKQALASSFAAIGDRIFWGRLKPMTAQICLLVWTLGGFYGWLFTSGEVAAPLWLIALGPLTGAAAYSAFAVYWRWKGLLLGYACGGISSCGLDAADWPRLIRRLSVAGFAFSLCIALSAFALAGAEAFQYGFDGKFALRLGLPLAVLAAHRAARKLGRSIFSVVGLVLAVSLVLFLALGYAPPGPYP